MAEAVKKTPFLTRLASLLVAIPMAPFELRRYRTWIPPGHYYSPIPDLDEVRRHEGRIFGVPAALPGIDLNADGQLRLLDELAEFYCDMPFGEDKKPGLRYYFNNEAYCHTDAIVLYSMLRHLKPKKLIEVGSGFSSAVSLDTNDLFLNGAIDSTFVEPYPERLLALLTEKDRAKTALIKKPLQEVGLDLFKKLKAGFHHDALCVRATCCVSSL